MTSTEAAIALLPETVEAAREEFDMAARFHKAWKPTAYDTDLHQRIGRSFAAHTFSVVRLALRREMVLAPMRLWDKPKETIRSLNFEEGRSDQCSGGQTGA